MASIPWTQPESWNLKWPKEQRMPDPCVEITHREYDWLWTHDSYGLEGINFSQLFLDWGSGPLVLKPQVSRDYLDRLHEKWLTEAIADERPIMTGHPWQTEHEFGKLLAYTPHTATVDFGGDIRNMERKELSMEIAYRGTGGWSMLQNLWGVHFYWFFEFGLAVADRYCDRKEYNQNAPVRGKDIFSRNISFLHGKGDFVANPDEKGYGYARRYFKLGCNHSWRELSQQECSDRAIDHYGKMWHVYECKNCHMIEAQDSSG